MITTISLSDETERRQVLPFWTQSIHHILSFGIPFILYFTTLLFTTDAFIVTPSSLSLSSRSFETSLELSPTLRQNYYHRTHRTNDQRKRIKHIQYLAKVTSKNQGDGDANDTSSTTITNKVQKVAISPNLSEYFAKKQDEPKKTINIKEPPQPDVMTIPITTTTTSDATFTESSGDKLDDDTIFNDKQAVNDIVIALQNVIENGNGSKIMITDIMKYIEQLQSLNQQIKSLPSNNRRSTNNNDNDNEDDDGTTMILMKNPKKRSNTVSKVKTLSKLSNKSKNNNNNIISSSSSSSGSSKVIQRLVQYIASSNIDGNGNDNDNEIHYRLLWVGSDETMSNFGTGLHKVPLARLQEVFLSIAIPAIGIKNNNNKQKSNNMLKQALNQFRVTATEVIRILGPFPNIKNTLQGTCTTMNNNNLESWNIIWESMIDGTGKELINTDTKNERNVLFNVLYGNEQIIVASIICIHNDNNDHTKSDSTTTTTTTPESILLFLREMDMEDKLTALRVL